MENSTQKLLNVLLQHYSEDEEMRGVLNDEVFELLNNPTDPADPNATYRDGTSVITMAITRLLQSRDDFIKMARESLIELLIKHGAIFTEQDRAYLHGYNGQYGGKRKQRKQRKSKKQNRKQRKSVKKSRK